MAHGLLVTIEPDSDLENPCGGEPWQWEAVSFSPIHSTYKDRDTFVNPDTGKYKPWFLAKLRAGTAFILDLYVHSGESWTLSDEGIQCQFDTVSGAGALLWNGPPKEIVKPQKGETPAERYTRREANARRAIDLYTEWVNGYGLYYAVENHDGEIIDSCGGYYSSDRRYVGEAIREVIQDYMRANKLHYHAFVGDLWRAVERGKDDTCYICVQNANVCGPSQEDIAPFPDVIA